jgi:branched-subunit amino acid ABC-type transport system permease component
VQTILKIIKNTHRHPVNQALHCVGAPFYAVGLGMTLGYLAGMQTNFAAGSAMLLAAMTMFVLGHKIEGNLGMMAPVLLFRFLRATLSRRRKVARYLFAKRVHLLRT